VNAIGADAKGKQELDPALLRAATVVVDDWEQASHSGEINVPFAQGRFRRHDLHAELADVVAGRRRGRRSRNEITVFDSTGVAILDIRFAQAVHERR
jgi:ornithine cyclodeaminase/alanine dehydrogenase-like protein (mu-crystallin family)